MNEIFKQKSIGKINFTQKMNSHKEKKKKKKTNKQNE